MQTERWNTGWTSRLGRDRTQPRARFSVTVTQSDAERLRCALFDRLGNRIERVVSVPGVELGAPKPTAVLQIVLDRNAIDEALHIVMSTAGRAQLGRVRRL